MGNREEDVRVKRNEKEYLGIYIQTTGCYSEKCRERMVQDLEIQNCKCERERQRKES